MAVKSKRLRDKVSNALAAATKPLRSADIEEITGVNIASVRNILNEMLAAGTCEKKRGWRYAAPEHRVAKRLKPIEIVEFDEMR